jgi:uncharacterized protein (DUF58 family)
MAYGSPDKFDYARRLAAGLAYIVLSNHETVSVSVFSGAYKMISTPARGKGKIHPVLRKLNELEAQGGSQLAQACKQFAASTRKSGLVCVISDFLMSEGVEAIAPLTGLGHQVELIQVLAPEELNPQLAGDLELVDAETNEAVEVSLGIHVMRKYHARLAALQAELRAFALRCGGDFFVAPTNTPLRDFVIGELRKGKLVR